MHQIFHPITLYLYMKALGTQEPGLIHTRDNYYSFFFEQEHLLVDSIHLLYDLLLLTIEIQVH